MRQYENGYDLTNDQKYNQWLKCYHQGGDQSECDGESKGECESIYYTCTCTCQV